MYQTLARDGELARNGLLVRDSDLAPDALLSIALNHARARQLDVAAILARDHARLLALSRFFVRDGALAVALGRERFLGYNLGFDPDFDVGLALALAAAPMSGFHLGTLTLEESLYSSLLQEGFRPELSSSWPPLGCRSLQGYIGNATLTGPGLVDFDLEGDGQTVHFSDPSGSEPMPLVQREYDLTFPMPAIPLGNLRRTCTSWRTDRLYQPLGVTPFLFPELHRIWPDHTTYLRETFQVPQIFALMPRLDLWSKPFAGWTEEDWSTCGLSALWDLDTGQVLWAHGAHHVDEVRTKGRPASEFFSVRA